MATAPQLDFPRTKTDWPALGWSYLYFWYFSGVLHLLLLFSGIRIFVGFRQAILASTLWLIPLLLFPGRTRQISAIVGFVLWLFSLVNLGYFCIYGQEFSQSVIFVIFESNAAEASEYFSQYFKWWMFPVVLLYSLIAFQLWQRIRPMHISRKGAKVITTVIVLALFVYPNFKQLRHWQFSPSVAASIVEARFEAAVPWQIVFGYKQYRHQLANVQDLLGQYNQTPPLQNLREVNSEIPATLVLIIGESTNRQHMSLYGYSRPTTPRLAALGKELTVFNGVVSAAAYTIGALKPVLSFSTSGDGDLQRPPISLIRMMKQAGYKTFWVTNQLTVAKNNTMLTSFSQQADQQFYLNNGRTRDSREFDGKVLEPFKRILDDPADKKFVVVHLLGTHTKYEYRYPPEFSVFEDRSGLPEWVTEEQMPVINSYDNAVLYNDFVVSSLIDTMASAQTNGLMVYFSDHGEDVFDSSTHDILGHNEDKPTKPMYTIPFVLWMSKKWKISHPRDFSSQRERDYVTSNFVHTWSDLIGLSFDGFDRQRSLVAVKSEDRAPTSAIQAKGK